MNCCAAIQLRRGVDACREPEGKKMQQAKWLVPKIIRGSRGLIFRLSACASEEEVCVSTVIYYGA